MAKEPEKLEKGRLTLTGTKMPDEVYKKLMQMGADRKLTPYIVNLVEKEDMMDKLIESLSSLTNTIQNIDVRFTNLEKRLESGNVSHYIAPATTEENIEEIKQGKLEISDKVVGGIEEEVEDLDF